MLDVYEMHEIDAILGGPVGQVVQKMGVLEVHLDPVFAGILSETIRRVKEASQEKV